MIFLLGVLDILAGITLLGLKFNLFTSVAWIFALLLLGKSLMFFGDWSSFIDLIVVGLFFLALIGSYNFLTILGVLWLIQKGVISLF